MRAPKFLAITLLAAVLATAACGTKRASAELAGYRISSTDGKQITVTYVTGPDDGPGHAEILDQNREHVKIQVRYKTAGGASNLIGVHHETQIDLHEPLGARKLINEVGTEVPAKTPDELPK